MATNYSPNPWSAGAVVFNQQPWEAFYERQAAKKQAKEDALNNYFKDLGKNITSAGMRSQDVPQLLQKNKEWQDLYSQNKAAILNPKLDNGKSYSDYTRLYQEQQALVNESKDAHKSMDEIGKMKLNPQMSYVFDDPKFMEQIQKHELPIGDPDRQGINLATISLPPQPVTTKDLEGYQKYLTGGIPFDKIPGQIEPLSGFKTKTPIYQQYSPENQMVIGQHAINAYETDPKWRREATKYFDEIQHNPEEYKRANTIHKQLYGNDIDSPKEAWAAKGILDNNMKATEFKEGKDEIGLWNYQEKIRHANAKELIDYKKKIDPNDTETNNIWYKSYLDNAINDAKSSGERRHLFTTGGKSIAYYNVIKPDPFLMKSFARGGKEPDRFGITESGELLPIFFQYDKDGNVKKDPETKRPLLDNEYTNSMSYEQGLVNLGYRGSTKKQLHEDQIKIQGTPKATNSNSDWKSRATKVN
jgi:hypothetical protein